MANPLIKSRQLASALTLTGTVTTDPFLLWRPTASVSQLHSTQSSVITSKDGTHLCANAYLDGAGAWQRIDTAQGATLFIVYPSGAVITYYAPAGANPISWTKPSITVMNAANVDSAWMPITLLNSWTAWEPGQANWNVPSYRKDPMGYVHIAGMAKSPATTTYMSTAMGQLPVGSRPNKYHFYTAPCQGTQVAEWYIQPDGQIVLMGLVPSGPVASTYYGLAGMTFLAEQ